MPQTRQHETVISLPASPEEVWRALTEAGVVQTWYASEARIDARQGGEYFVSWGPGMDATGVIEVFEPDRHLRVVAVREKPGDWSDPSKDESTGAVRMAMDFHLESAQGGTTLRLVHSGFLSSAEWDGEFEGTKQGWPIMFRIMRYGLTTHPRTPGRQKWLYLQTALPQKDAWERVAALFDGKPVTYSNEPSEFCAPWSELGDGLVFAAFATRGAATGISLNVVLWGEAASRIDEAAALWQAKLQQLGGAVAAAG